VRLVAPGVFLCGPIRANADVRLTRTAPLHPVAAGCVTICVNIEVPRPVSGPTGRFDLPVAWSSGVEAHGGVKGGRRPFRGNASSAGNRAAEHP
jgi:hypothetical protein